MMPEVDEDIDIEAGADAGRGRDARVISGRTSGETMFAATSPFPPLLRMLLVSLEEE